MSQNDDERPEGPGDGGDLAADPFQELERMFGSLLSPPTPTGGPDAEPPADTTSSDSPRTAGADPETSSPTSSPADDAPRIVPAKLEWPPLETEEAAEMEAADESTGSPIDIFDADTAQPQVTADPQPSLGGATEPYSNDPAVDAAEEPLGESTPTPQPAPLLSPQEATKTPVWARPEAVQAEAPEEAPPAPDAADLDTLVAALDRATPEPVLVSPDDADGAPQHPQHDAARSGGRRCIVFTVAETRYALQMGHVIEVGAVPAVTPLPHVPAWLLGVSNLRGDVLAVLDLRQFLGHPTSGRLDDRRLLILQTENTALTAGLVVDKVHGAASVAPDLVRAPTAPLDDLVEPLLQGVVEQDGRLLAVLDAEKLLTSNALRPFAAPMTNLGQAN